MVVRIYGRLCTQLGQLRTLLLGAVSQVLNGGTMIRAREVLLQTLDQPQESIHGRIAVGVGVELKSGAPKHLSIGAQHGLRHHPDTLMAIEIAGRAHLGESRENRAVDHEFEVVAHHHAIVVTGLPCQYLRQGLLGGFPAGQKVDNDRCQDESHRHGVGAGCGAHARDLADGIAEDAGAHVQCGGDTSLMQHGEKVKHAAAEPLWCEQETKLGHHGLQAILVEVASCPVSAFVHLRVGLSHSQQSPRCVVANQLMEGAMPKHHGLLSKHLVQILPPDLTMPEGVIAPGNEGHGGVAVLGCERGQSRTIAFGSGLAGELSCGQGPVIGRQKRELGEHCGQGGVHVGVDESRQQSVVGKLAVDPAVAGLNKGLQRVFTTHRDDQSVLHCDRSGGRQGGLHGADQLSGIDHQFSACRRYYCQQR